MKSSRSSGGATRTRSPWCRGEGAPGFAGGCVPITGGVVVELSRMTQILQFDPELWRIRVQAGMRTAHLHRLARENGLRFPPDPGASEESQIGGNIATNAGGPHAYKHGTTGDYVTGLRAGNTSGTDRRDRRPAPQRRRRL